MSSADYLPFLIQALLAAAALSAVRSFATGVRARDRSLFTRCAP